MGKLDAKETKIEHTGLRDEKKDGVTNDLLDFLSSHSESIVANADCYIFGEDITITFEECSGKELLDLINSVEDYGIDLENVQVHADGDGWISVDLIIG